MANEGMMPPPGGMPAPQQNPAEGQPVGPEEMKENPLEKIATGDPFLSKVKSQMLGIERQRVRNSEMNAINKKVTDELREVVIGKLEKILGEFGVDVADPNSINEFMESLKVSDPDMALLFETVFESLRKKDTGVDAGVLSAGRDLKKAFSSFNKKKAETGMTEDEMPTEEAPVDEAPVEEMPPMPETA